MSPATTTVGKKKSEVSSRSTRPASSIRVRLVDPAKPRRIRLRLRGMSPLLLDPMTEEVARSMVTGVKLQIAKDRPLEQVCREKLDAIRDSETGRLALPRRYLWGALHTAGEHVKYKGRMNIATVSQPGKAGKSRLAAFFFIEDKQFVLFDDDGQEPSWEVDLQVGTGAMSKNAVVRPLIENWNFETVIQYDDGDVSEGTIRELFSKAGKMIGLGCKRACLKNGECGQFVVGSWEDITPADWPGAKSGKAKRQAPRDEDEEEESGEDGENGNGEE